MSSRKRKKGKKRKRIEQKVPLGSPITHQKISQLNIVIVALMRWDGLAHKALGGRYTLM